MPAQSQQQQKLFGLALAFKRGEVPASEVSDEVKAIADRMSEKEIEDFASTKHKGLPKMKEQLRKIVREIMRERVISEIELSKAEMDKLHSDGEVEVDGEKVTYDESVNEGKDDFMARHGRANINLKKGYKHHTADELEDLYNKLGKLVKGLKVKDVNLVFESVNKNESKYTNQTGIKSALMKDSNFSSLLNPKEIKWINGSDVKIYKGIGMNFSFTDGKSEMIVNVNKPMSIVKKLGRVGNDVKKVYQQNESVNEARNFKKAKQALIDFNNGKIGEDDMVKSVVKSLGFNFDEFSEEEAGLELSSKIKKGKIPTDNYILNNVIDVLSESVNEGYSTEEKRIVMMAVRKLAKYRNVPLDYAINDLLGAGQELERDIKKGKIK